MSSSHGLERGDTPEPIPKQQLFSEITYENLDTAASEASLRGRHRHSPASSSTTSSVSAGYGGWSRFSVDHGGDATIRSAAGNSIFTGRLSFKRSLQWNPTASVDRKLRERRLSLWRYGSLEGASSSQFRTPQAPRDGGKLVCFALSFLTAGIALVVLVVCLRLTARSGDPLDVAQHMPALPCDQYEYCDQETKTVQRWINHTVKPCDDFHEFACGVWTRSHGGYSAHDEEKVNWVLNTLLTRALSEMAEKPAAAANGSTFEFELANDVLFEQCMKTDSRERRSLGMARKQLAEFGLGGWPYTQQPHHDVTFTNVLVTASRLALNLGLAALVSVRVFGSPQDRTFEVDDPILLLRKDDLSGFEMKARALVLHRQLIAESFFYFAHTSRDVYKVQEQIQLVSLILAHATRRASERRFCTFSHVTTALGELGILELYIRRLMPDRVNISDNSTVLLRNPLIARALDFVFRYLGPEHLLNYLGFRLLVHLSPFIFEIPNNIVRARMNQLTGVDKMVWLKAEVCLRLSEEALPLFYLYDLYATKPAAYWQNIDSFVRIVKRAVLSRAVVPWKFSAEDKKKLLRILMLMEFKTFLPHWLLNDTLLEAYNRRLLPNRNADIFQMYSHVWRRRTHAALSPRPLDKYLTEPEWQGSVFDTMPVYSFAENTVYVPMALFNTTLPATQDAFYLHAVAATWKLAYALAPIFELSNYWDNATLASYTGYEACAAIRYGPYLTPGIRDSALHLSYADEISVFWSERLLLVLLSTSGVNPLVGYDRERFFYLYTAMSKCRSYGVSLQPTSTVTIKQRVNIPYQYSAKFRKLWSCKNHNPCK
uniref:Gluzincin n=1 Tax=Rhipicephalus appendiculatus TaxID=34631 RepID=A0A131YR24_RHIAP